MLFVFVVLFAFMVGCSLNDKRSIDTPVAEIEATENSDVSNWQTAYISFLKDFPAPEDNEILEFSLRDLDGDGVPELIICQMDNAAYTKDLLVYSYENSIYKIGEFENAGSYASALCITDNPMFGGLFLLWYGGGVERYGYLSVEDRELKYEYLFYYDRTVEPHNKGIISDNEQLVEEADNAFPPYDYYDNILEMYNIGDFDAFGVFLLDTVYCN